MVAGMLAASIALFPAPNSLIVGEGSFLVPRRAQIVFNGNLPLNDKWRLSQALRAGLDVQESTKGPRVRFILTKGACDDESYKLTVAPSTITVSAPSAKGMFWSIQSLRQLADKGRIPCVEIDDRPKHKWRGVLLDEGRHFMGEQMVKQFLDVLALYKFNVLHWHLTEDQGWRVQVRSMPRLTQHGGYRTEAGGAKYGGFYTQGQIRAIIKYAADRNITIIPEVEMPGHSLAAISSYPVLGCTKQEIAVPPTWGVFGDVLCAGRESTFAFIDQVLKEVAPLFPSPYFHIGGDEVPKARWKQCPDCQARIKAEGLKDEHELQSWFVRRVQSSLKAIGKTLIGWDEIMEGGLAPGAVVQVWTDIAQADKALASGNPYILSPSSHLYLNRPADDLPLKAVAEFSIPAHLETLQLLGLETTLWSEEITPANLLPKFLPRGAVVAEKFWGSPTITHNEMNAKLLKHKAFLRRVGVAYGPEDKRIATYQVERSKHGVVVRSSAGMPAIVFRATVDGTTPNGSSPIASLNLKVPAGKTAKIAPFLGTSRIDEPKTVETTTHNGIDAKSSFANPPAPQYAKPGLGGLTDGILGSLDFHDGLWLGWQGQDLKVTIELTKPSGIREINLRCLQQMRSWILLPTSVVFEVSADGEHWASAGIVSHNVQETMEVATIHTFAVSLRQPVQAKFVRVTAMNYGKLPDWHNGAGGAAWLFADEVIVR